MLKTKMAEYTVKLTHIQYFIRGHETGDDLQKVQIQSQQLLQNKLRDSFGRQTHGGNAHKHLIYVHDMTVT